MATRSTAVSLIALSALTLAASARMHDVSRQHWVRLGRLRAGVVDANRGGARTGASQVPAALRVAPARQAAVLRRQQRFGRHGGSGAAAVRRAAVRAAGAAREALTAASGSPDASGTMDTGAPGSDAVVFALTSLRGSIPSRCARGAQRGRAASVCDPIAAQVALNYANSARSRTT